MKVTGYKRFFVEMAVLFIVYLAVAALHGCAIAKINSDTQRAYMFGIGAYKNEKGAEISTKVFDGVPVNYNAK